MGKGDKKTRKGKIFARSHGKLRPKAKASKVKVANKIKKK